MIVGGEGKTDDGFPQKHKYLTSFCFAQDVPLFPISSPSKNYDRKFGNPK